MAKEHLSEIAKIVNAGPAEDLNGGLDCDYVSMENFAHMTIIVSHGIITNAANITVEEMTTNAGVGNALTFRYRQNVSGAEDALGAAATSASLTTGTVNLAALKSNFEMIRSLIRGSLHLLKDMVIPSKQLRATLVGMCRDFTRSSLAYATI